MNDAPTIATTLADVSVNEDTAIAIAIPVGTFADVDGDLLTLSASLVGGTALPNWLVFDGDAGTLTGQPPENFNGVLNVEVAASDGTESIVSSFVLTTVPVNDAPVAADDDGFTVESGGDISIDAATLLVNDTDADGDMLTIASVGNANGGSVTQQTDGSVRFSADVGFQGEATFTYDITDGAGRTATGTVTLDVTGGSTDPYADFYQGNDWHNFLVGDYLRETKIFGAGGNDKIFGRFLHENHLAGGDGRDKLFGGAFSDQLDGNAGHDRLYGGLGNDILSGGTGNDKLHGGWGDDVFVFTEGDGHDTVHDFSKGGNFWFFNAGKDSLYLDVDGVETYEDALDAAHQQGRHVVFDFGDGDQLTLRHTRLNSLTEDHFDIV